MEIIVSCSPKQVNGHPAEGFKQDTPPKHALFKAGLQNRQQDKVIKAFCDANIKKLTCRQ